MKVSDFLKRDFSTKFHNFVLLKGIFNDSLYDAIMQQDEPKILSIIHLDYAYELEEGFFQIVPLDLEKLKSEFITQCNDEEYLKRFL